MKTTLITLIVAGVVAAWDFSDQPQCIASCLKEAIPKAGCELDDIACACRGNTREKLKTLTDSCISNCPPDEIQKAPSIISTACSKITELALGEMREEYTTGDFSSSGTESEADTMNGSQAVPRAAFEIDSSDAHKAKCAVDSKCDSRFSCSGVFRRQKNNICAIKKTPCKHFFQCNPLNVEGCISGHCYALRDGNKTNEEECHWQKKVPIHNCGDKLVCDARHSHGTGKGTCKSVGDCNKTSDCVKGLVCFEGTCRGKGGKGQPCKAAVNCSGALSCYNNKCAPRVYKETGEKCSSFIECRSAACTDGVCEAPWKKGKCTNDSDCKSGNWCYSEKCCPMNTPKDDPCRLQA